MDPSSQPPTDMRLDLDLGRNPALPAATIAFAVAPKGMRGV